MRQSLSFFICSLVILSSLAFSANAQSQERKLPIKRTALSYAADRQGITELNELLEKSYRVQTSFDNVQSFTAKIVSESRAGREFVLQGIEIPFKYKLTIYPEKVLHLQDIITQKITVIDLNEQDSSKTEDTTFQHRLTDVVRWLDRHSWDLSKSTFFGHNQMDGFCDDSTRLKKCLVERASRLCPKRKHLNTELVVLTSHSAQGKYYGYYNFKCKE